MKIMKKKSIRYTVQIYAFPFVFRVESLLMQVSSVYQLFPLLIYQNYQVNHPLKTI